MKHYLESNVPVSDNIVLDFALKCERDVISEIDNLLVSFHVSPQDSIKIYEQINKLVQVKETINLLSKE